MNSLAATIVTAAVALSSALLSAIIAMYSIYRSGRERRETRSQDTAMNLLPRRLDAYEAVWRGLFTIEQTRKIAPDVADSLVEKSIWLPGPLRTSLLEFLLADPVDVAKAKQVRSLLLEDEAIKNVDVAMSRLRAEE